MRMVNKKVSVWMFRVYNVHQSFSGTILGEISF